jgi:hypothetical protein
MVMVFGSTPMRSAHARTSDLKICSGTLSSNAGGRDDFPFELSNLIRYLYTIPGAFGDSHNLFDSLSNFVRFFGLATCLFRIGILSQQNSI